LGDQIKNNEMGGECSMYRGQEKCIKHFGGVRERDYLEDLGIDGRIILQWMCKEVE
jgi:hypothetical protein